MAHDHRRIEELSAATCWSLISRATVGRIALHGADGDIEIFPINFVVHDGSIVFKTASGTKLALVHECERSTFETDDFDFYEGIAWSVVAKGTTEVVRDDVAIATDPPTIRAWQRGHKPNLVRLIPDVMTGRRFPIDPAANITA